MAVFPLPPVPPLSPVPPALLFPVPPLLEPPALPVLPGFGAGWAPPPPPPPGWPAFPPEPPGELPMPGLLSFAGALVGACCWLVGADGGSAVASVAVLGVVEGSAGRGSLGAVCFVLFARRACACARWRTSAWYAART